MDTYRLIQGLIASMFLLFTHSAGAQNGAAGIFDPGSLASSACSMSDDPTLHDDCNYCARNVVQQFTATFGSPNNSSRTCRRNCIPGKTSVSRWSFRWDDPQPPEGRIPDELFDPAPPGAASAHVQGFVRTNDDRFPWAGSHSSRKNDSRSSGGIFFVQKPDAGASSGLFLAGLYSSIGPAPKREPEWHPSGVQVLGDYLFVELRDRYLHVFNVEKIPSPQSVFHDFSRKHVAGGDDPAFEKFSGGGGLAMTRIGPHRYLLVTAQPGGRSGSPGDRFFYFFHLVGEIGVSGGLSISFLGRAANPFSNGWLENISILRECASEDIFVVQTSDVGGPSADGYWGLSEIVWNGHQPALEKIGWWGQDRELANSDHRSAATVHVTESGEIQFHSHEYKTEENTEWDNEDYFEFTDLGP